MEAILISRLIQLNITRAYKLFITPTGANQLLKLAFKVKATAFVPDSVPELPVSRAKQEAGQFQRGNGGGLQPEALLRDAQAQVALQV